MNSRIYSLIGFFELPSNLGTSLGLIRLRGGLWQSGGEAQLALTGALVAVGDVAAEAVLAVRALVPAF